MMQQIFFIVSQEFQRKIKTVYRIDVTEHGGTPEAARVQLKNGTMNAAPTVDIRLQPGESKHITFDPPLQFPDGFCLQISVGAARGTFVGT